VVRESGWYFRSAEGLDNVLGPDLLVLSPQDYEKTTESGWFEGRPLFVVEVVSPSERRSRRLQKVGLYLEAGAGAVVEVDLTKRIVLVHIADSEIAQTIRSGRIEYPFRAELSDIFARLPEA
jgi:Uma2 family endonuclease